MTVTDAETIRRRAAVLYAGGMPARVLKDAADGKIVGVAEIETRNLRPGSKASPR